MEDSTLRVAQLAVDMRDQFIRRFHNIDYNLSIRIGFHTGRVMAGVIGRVEHILFFLSFVFIIIIGGVSLCDD